MKALGEKDHPIAGAAGLKEQLTAGKDNTWEEGIVEIFRAIFKRLTKLSMKMNETVRRIWINF